MTVSTRGSPAATGNASEGYAIYRWSGSGWTEMSTGKGVQIITAGVDQPVVLSGYGTHSGNLSAGQVYRGHWNGGHGMTWTNIDGPETCSGWSAASWLAGTKDLLYALGCNMDSNGNHDIYSYSDGWSKALGGAAVDISAAPDGSSLWADAYSAVDETYYQYSNNILGSGGWTKHDAPRYSYFTAAGLNGTAYSSPLVDEISPYTDSWTGSEWIMGDIPCYAGYCPIVSVGTNGTAWLLYSTFQEPIYSMTPPPVATPPTPLGSNSNYVLANPNCALDCTTSCSPLLDVTVSVHITGGSRRHRGALGGQRESNCRILLSTECELPPSGRLGLAAVQFHH